MMYKKNENIIKKIRSNFFQLIIFIVLIFVSLAPFFWGVITSMKSKREIFSYPPKIIGFNASIEHYKTIFKSGFLSNIQSSILNSFGTIILCLFVALIAAYGIHRYRFRGRKILFYMIIAGMPLSIGHAAMLIPNYIYMSKLGLIDHWYTLIIMYTALNIPMATWIMKGGIENVPIEVEEAASIDGAGRPYIIFNLIPNLCKPSITSAALFIFINTWNEFIFSSVMINSARLRTVQSGIYSYLGYFGQEWGPLTAATTISMIPVLIAFSFLAKFLISGLTKGAVKG